MGPHELLSKADHLAQALVHESRVTGVSYGDLLQMTQMALRLLRATYPGSSMDVLELSQQADAIFSAMTQKQAAN